MTETVPAPPLRSIEPRLPYRIRSAETWDLVRTHYLRGETARALSERYGVSVSNIRRRAGDEGWTRKGHAEAVDHFRLEGPADAVAAAAAQTTGGFDEPYPGLTTESLDEEPCTHPRTVARLALAAAARALRAGRYVEAERLGKLTETLLKIAGPARGGVPGHAELEDAVLATDDRDRLARVQRRVEAGLDAILADMEEMGDLQDIIRPRAASA